MRMELMNERMTSVGMAIRLAWAAVLAAFLVPAGCAVAQDKPAKTLYQRMGGYDAIAGIVDDFIAQLGKDPAFERFGGGRSMDSLHRTRQLVVDQICNLTEGPCVYIGRDMKTAHAGLKIREAEWNSTIDKFKVSLNKFEVGPAEQDEFLATIAKLKPDIVAPPNGQTSKAETPKSQN